MTEQTQETQETAQEQVQLSLQDIATCVQIIDICSRRGAFEGQEMEGIGALRNRVAKFLDANKPPEAEAGEAEAEAGEAVPEA